MSGPLKVVGLTSWRITPSARFRVGHFVEPLAALGVDLQWRPGLLSRYPPERRYLRPFWLPAALAVRLPDIARSHLADVTLFNREFISTLITLEGLTGKPRVFDVDDAIFLRRGGGFARRLAQQMDVIVAGNTFLADWFSQHHDHVEVVPTAVDVDRFCPRATPRSTANGSVHIGWMGTGANLIHLEPLAPALARLLASRPEVRIRVCADQRPQLESLPADRVDFVPWSPAAEVPFLRSLDVGIMPLQDSDLARGKCAFKMLLYMACGLPVVVSPVGMNADVLSEAAVGYGVNSLDDWCEALIDLADDIGGRQKMGQAGREIVLAKYSVQAVAPQLAAILHQAAGRKPPAAHKAGGEL